MEYLGKKNDETTAVQHKTKVIETKKCMSLERYFWIIGESECIGRDRSDPLPSSQFESCQKVGKHGGKLDACI